MLFAVLLEFHILAEPCLILLVCPAGWPSTARSTLASLYIDLPNLQDSEPMIMAIAPLGSQTCGTCVALQGLGPGSGGAAPQAYSVAQQGLGWIS